VVVELKVEPTPWGNHRHKLLMEAVEAVMKKKGWDDIDLCYHTRIPPATWETQKRRSGCAPAWITLVRLVRGTGIKIDPIIRAEEVEDAGD